LSHKYTRAARQEKLYPAYWEPTFKNEGQKEHDMTTYPIEFHRRLEQEWASRIEQILTVTSTAPPPRGPNDDDDDEVEDEEDEDQPDEPAVVREPDED
jgi:hypothetical protein